MRPLVLEDWEVESNAFLVGLKVLTFKHSAIGSCESNGKLTGLADFVGLESVNQMHRKEERNFSENLAKS